MGDIGKPVRETERPAPVRAPVPEREPAPAPAPERTPARERESEPVETKPLAAQAPEPGLESVEAWRA